MSKKVPIGTAAQLLEALESTDFALQAAVMQTISKDPAKALSYGRHEGRDVVAHAARLGLWLIGAPGIVLRSLLLTPAVTALSLARLL